MTRLLDLPASALSRLDRPGLVDAVRASEGRVVAAETIGAYQPLLEDVTNAEIVAAMGADIVLLNLFDVTAPAVTGLPDCAPGDVLREVQRLTGRVVGINLEPTGVPGGRLATAHNAAAAAEMGAQLIVVTANPKTGADNAATAAAIRTVSDAVGSAAMVVGGRMHGSGARTAASSAFLSADDVAAYVDAGADVVLVPAPGTVPGLTLDAVGTLVDAAHTHGALALTAIGTSQEGADVETIRSIALACKQAGADIHHLGDGGFTGIAVPENILRYAIAIRGVRHTYRRMALSIRR